MNELKVVGQSSERVDSLEKVTGAAHYVDDLNFGPELLYACLVESPYAHAEIKKIGTAKGSTSEQNVAKSIPTATVLSFDDYPQAFLALQQGKVFAVTTDEAILAGILAKSPNKDQFEIPHVQISDEPYGLGMRKGDDNLVAFVNKAILEMEQSGEAKAIFAKWFGPTTPYSLERTFAITPEK